MPTYPKSGPLTLTANIAEYVNTKALRAGIASDLVKIDFTGPKVANQGFKPMIREGKFDISELAIVSFLQAREVGKPLVLCPVPILSRFQHQCISYNLEKCGGEITPKQVEGKRAVFLSTACTIHQGASAMWVRSILKHECGVDLGKIKWVSYDPPHPAEVSDPAFVEKYVPDERNVEQMLVDGSFDVAIIGAPIKGEPKVRTLFPDAEAAGLGWFRKFGVVPVNHYLVVSKDLSEQRPDVLPELYRMLAASKAANPLTTGGVDMLPMGYEANKKTLEAVIMYATEQGLIKKPFKVEELFDKATIKMGA